MKMQDKVVYSVLRKLSSCRSQDRTKFIVSSLMYNACQHARHEDIERFFISKARNQFMMKQTKFLFKLQHIHFSSKLSILKFIFKEEFAVLKNPERRLRISVNYHNFTVNDSVSNGNQKQDVAYTTLCGQSVHVHFVLIGDVSKRTKNESS